MLESDELRLQSFNLRDVVGKTIMCEDGVKRRVEQISYSHRYADKVLINEILEDETPGGAWVHVLSLSCQMYGNPLPTVEQKRAFTRFARSLRWNQSKDQEGITLPSGIVLPQ